jgi:O-antigen/teichoic acid export membrane protein
VFIDFGIMIHGDSPTHIWHDYVPFGLIASLELPALFNQTELTLTILVVGVSILIEPFGFLANSMMQRDFQSKRLAMGGIASVLAAAAGTVSAAVLGPTSATMLRGMTSTTKRSWAERL